MSFNDYAQTGEYKDEELEDILRENIANAIDAFYWNMRTKLNAFDFDEFDDTKFDVIVNKVLSQMAIDAQSDYPVSK